MVILTPECDGLVCFVIMTLENKNIPLNKQHCGLSFHLSADCFSKSRERRVHIFFILYSNSHQGRITNMEMTSVHDNVARFKKGSRVSSQAK